MLRLPLTIIQAEATRLSLRRFTREAWHTFEPAKLIWNWHMDTLCDHLSYVSTGDIRFLMINIPPRTSKSLVTSVAYPVWDWLQDPTLQFLTASYTLQLSMRDALKSRRLIESPWFQQRWGHRFRFAFDEKLKRQYSNDKGGRRIAIATESATTGEGGNRLICFPYDEVVQTSAGLIPIGEIVERRLTVQLPCLDTATGQMTQSHVVGWVKNPGSEIVRVTLVDGSSIRCTPDHRIWTRHGWVAACDLTGADEVATAPDQTFGCMLPLPAVLDAVDLVWRNSELCSQNSDRSVTGENLDDLSGVELSAGTPCPHREGSVPHCVCNVLSASAVMQVAESTVGSIAVAVSDLLPGGAQADESLERELMREAVDGLARDAQGYARISLVEDRRQNLSGHAALLPRGVRVPHTRETSDSAVVGNLIAGSVDDRQPIFVRVASVERIGHVETSYCLEVAEYHTFCVGAGYSFIVANCDDPHNATDVESEIKRKGTHDWWDHAMVNRMNRPEQDAWILCGQRTGADDLFGHVEETTDMSKVVKVVLPNEFDPKRKCITYAPSGKKIFEDPREVKGELLCPQRTGIEATRRLKRSQGHTYGLQYQQDSKSSVGKVLKRDDWREWEGEIPECQIIVQVYDTAFEEGEENDYSARTDWGLFVHNELVQNDDGESIMSGLRLHLILLGAWHEKVSYNTLRTKATTYAKKTKPDEILVEKKATGILLARDLQTRLRNQHTSVKRVSLAHGPHKLDKLERAHLASPMLEQGLVWYPKGRKWPDEVIDECANFPDGKNDDYVDTVTMALVWLRRKVDDPSAWEAEKSDGTVRLFKRRRPLYG